MSIISAYGSKLRSAFSQFAPANSGNVAIVFGFSLIPLVGLVGVGVDYGVALTDKSKLDNASDAAALAAVATAKAYVAANPNDTNLTNDAITAGLAQAASTFVVNAGNVPFAQIPVVQTASTAAPTPLACPTGNACVYLSRTNQTFTSTTTYLTTTQNHFGQIFGSPTIKVTGTSVASADIPSYLDFYLLIDVSGSMGLPATTNGQNALAAINFDNYSAYQQGCQFACHFPGYTGFTLAMNTKDPDSGNNGILLRSGSVNNAVCAFLTKTAAPAVANQYRVGIYPFVTMMTNQFAPLSSNYTGLFTAMQCVTNAPSSYQPHALDNLLDTGTTQYAANLSMTTGTGSGGTNLGTSAVDTNSIFLQAQTEVAAYTSASSLKDGSSGVNSKPFVFLITDGMENPQHYATNRNNPYYYLGGSFDGLRYPTAMTPSQCTALKNAGVTISILYIPYVKLIYKSDPYNENLAANNAISNLPTNLQQCSGSKDSTANFFYTANSPTDVTASLNSMFNQAVQVAHLQK